MKPLSAFLVFAFAAVFASFSNAQTCSSMRDYETGLKNGLRMAPPCELTNAKLPKCPGEYSAATWSNCYGERTAASGGSYRGGYLEGKAHGKGEFVNPDGTRYLGFYEKGKRNGAGKEYNANGEIAKAGEWSNGVFSDVAQREQTTTQTSNLVLAENKQVFCQPLLLIYKDWKGNEISSNKIGSYKPITIYITNNKLRAFYPNQQEKSYIDGADFEKTQDIDGILRHVFLKRNSDGTEILVTLAKKPMEREITLISTSIDKKLPHLMEMLSACK